MRPEALSRQALSRQALRRAPGKPVGHHLPIEAVDDDGKIALEARQRELGDVGEPLLVLLVRVEVPLHQITRMRTNLAFIRAVGALLPVVDDEEPLLAHQAANDLFGDDDRLLSVIPAPEGAPHALGPERLPASLEDRADAPADFEVLVGAHGGALGAMVGAAGDLQALALHADAKAGLQRVDHRRLLAIGQLRWADAWVFFSMPMVCLSIALSISSSRHPLFSPSMSSGKSAGSAFGIVMLSFVDVQ